MNIVKKVFFHCSVIVLAGLLLQMSCQKKSKIKLPAHNKFVFLSNRDTPERQFNIFIMDVDSDSIRNLTDKVESVRSISLPDLSADQNKVLFVAFEGLNTSLQVIDVHNLSVTHVIDVNMQNPQASFSSSGDKILFINKVGDNRQIHLINSDGTGVQNLSNNNCDEFDAVFSPDDSKIAYVSNQGGTKSIWIMNADGSQKRRLPGKGTNDGHPSFSPDGNKVVFHSLIDGSPNIFIGDVSKWKTKVLFQDKAQCTEPQFSPDGNTVLFLSNLRGMKYRDIVALNLKTRDVKVVSQKIGTINFNPNFSPDGRRIVFESITANGEIFIVDVDGQNLRNLTNHPSWDTLPSF